MPPARCSRSTPLRPGAQRRSSCHSLGQRRLPEALSRCQRQLLRRQAAGDARGVAACYLQLGDLYLASGELEQAEQMYRRSLEIARHLEQPTGAAEGVRPAP
ncbi:MAG: tetratricopeptide repeat protein [Myxococcales bacterium]|nr:tetratricopeptide repeat protein [Myxococcota bacterium]MDW8282728.1 tetratricopeptide repeat protein [Myxococcales bacterium]